MKRMLCAIIALVMLCLSGCSACAAEETGGAQVLSAEEDARMHAEKQRRIDEILSCTEEIRKADTWVPGETYTGTAYYISPNGDDGNDGMTPETAKKTMDWLSSAVSGEPTLLQPGDAVFLERGGIYRVDPSGLWTLNWMAEGVTLSAYGEGPKPILTASPENGTGAENWIPVYEDENGRKIWQYARELPDIGAVILNDGEVYASRVYEFWTGDGYEPCEAEYYLMEASEGVVLKGELLPLETALEEDLQIISRPDLSGMESYYMDSMRKGPLYLRCDAGNPGELYTSIEFCPANLMGMIWLQGARNVFDNISFRCGGTAYIKNGKKAAGPDGKEPSGAEVQGTIIQNCEFAFGGAAVSAYSENEHGGRCVWTQGDGVYSVTNNTVFRNNYCHDAACTTFGFEAALDAEEGPEGTLEILDNVIDGTFGLRLDNTSDALKNFKSVVVRGNQIWDTGRVESGNYYYAEGSIFCMFPFHGEYIVQDNLFYCSEKGSYGNALIRGYDAESWGSAPTYTGNTYVQHSARKFADWWIGGIYISDPRLKEKAARFLGDADGIFRIIEDDVPDSSPMQKEYYGELPPETGILEDEVTGDVISDSDRAAELGLPMDQMEQESVSGKEMMALLDILVAAAAPEKAGEWQQMYTQLREHTQPLTRFDAMAMLYLAAQFIGGDYLPQDTGEVAYAVSRLQFQFDHPYFTEGLFEGIDGPQFSVPVFGDGFYLDATSLFFNLWRPVPGSGVYPFDYDEGNNSVHEFDQPTYAEAVRAVARLSLIGGLAGER